MKFIFTKKGFNDTGKEYEAKVTRKYINGVMTERNCVEQFACYSDIRVIEMTEEDMNAPSVD